MELFIGLQNGDDPFQINVNRKAVFGFASDSVNFLFFMNTMS